MRRALILAFFITCTTFGALAQNDSITISRTRWQTKKIAPGVRLKQFTFNGNLFGANQNVNILEIDPRKGNDILVGYEPAMLKKTSQFARESKATAAINGTFFNMKDGGSVDYVRSRGKVVQQNKLEAGNRRALHQKAAFVVNKNLVRIKQWDGTDTWEDRLEGEEVMLSGPLLVKNEQAQQHDSTETYLTRHPRTAVGLKGKKLLMVTVDGRSEIAAGMNLFELGRFMKWLGAENAMNFDGGGSTTMWISGEPDNGIVNYPSDNIQQKNTAAFKPGMDLDNLPASTKQRDKSGERPVANVLIVTRRK